MKHSHQTRTPDRVRGARRFFFAPSPTPVLALAALAVALHGSGVWAARKSLIVEYDTKIKQKSMQLDSIKVELKRGRKTLKDLSEKEGTEDAQIRQLGTAMASTQRYLRGLSEQIDSVTAVVGVLKDSLAESQRRLAARQHDMEGRLRSMYLASPTRVPEGLRMLDIVLFSGGVDEMLHRARYFQELNRYDRMLLRQIDSARAVIAERTAQVEKRLAQLGQLRDEKDRERRTLVSQEKTHRDLLVSIQSQRKAYEDMVGQLESAEAQVRQIIETLARQRTKAKTEIDRGLKVAFEKRKGKLLWPVQGTVVQEFGRIVHPVYKTVTMSSGIDISGSPGQAVRCVAQGKVVHVGALRGLGNLLIVDHGGGYLSVYANLAVIGAAKEQQVEYGTVVGTTGKNGRLHFEVRKLAEALNPREWLE